MKKCPGIPSILAVTMRHVGKPARGTTWRPGGNRLVEIVIIPN